MTEFIHRPVMLNECIESLKIKPGGVYVDGTIGGGGHSEIIAKHLLKPDNPGILIGIDRDAAAVAAVENRIKDVILVRDRHENIREVLEGLKISAVDGFLLDLGVSSYQLDTPDRGFSYRYDAPLDMRMDDRDKLTAYDVVNDFPERELAGIIRNFGEERYSKRVARAICRERPVKTTLELAQIVAGSIPKFKSKKSKSDGHPAMRTFQAIRIAVNGELTGLARTIEDMARLLAPGGRICIITFHSLEDRIVKQSFRHWADPCKCPRDLPYCVCGEEPILSVITKKPIRPSPDEINENPRAHSAKLRVSERI